MTWPRVDDAIASRGAARRSRALRASRPFTMGLLFALGLALIVLLLPYRGFPWFIALTMLSLTLEGSALAALLFALLFPRAFRHPQSRTRVLRVAAGICIGTLFILPASVGSDAWAVSNLTRRGRAIESFAHRYREVHGAYPGPTAVPSDLLAGELRYNTSGSSFRIWFPTHGLCNEICYLDESGGEWRSIDWFQGD